MSEANRADPPRALLLTVLGAYMRALGGWMSVAGLVRVLGELGVEEQAVRSAVARFKRRGILESEQRGRLAGYRLSEEGLRLIEQGDARIYGRPRTASLADGWALAVFSVPDSKRADRHLLRSQLSWLGYGNLSSAVWIAPWHVAGETRETLLRLGLADYVNLFHAHYQAFGALPEIVARCWDLDGLRARYAEFLRDAELLRRRWPRGAAPVGAAALGDHVALLSMWRPLPFLDPGLPIEALPPRWPGPAAWEAFHELIGALAEPAVARAAELAGEPVGAPGELIAF